MYELKIIDFGLGKIFDKAKEKNLHGLVGTAYYVAPEVIDGVEYGFECDYWALGVILYVMLSGNLPFSGVKNSEIFDKIKKQ